jgi:hypothetical protein
MLLQYVLPHEVGLMERCTTSLASMLAPVRSGCAVVLVTVRSYIMADACESPDWRGAVKN